MVLKSLYTRLLWIALLTATCVVTLGAYVRLSDAGLGCPDWPGCYGTLNPLMRLPIGTKFKIGMVGRPLVTYRITSRATVPPSRRRRLPR